MGALFFIRDMDNYYYEKKEVEMVDKIFAFIFLGIFVLSFAFVLIKFTIWEYKAEKEIERMEEELNQLRNEEDESN